MYGYQPMDDDRFRNVMVVRSSIPKFCDEYILIFNVDVIVREQPILCLPVASPGGHILIGKVKSLVMRKKCNALPGNVKKNRQQRALLYCFDRYR